MVSGWFLPQDRILILEFAGVMARYNFYQLLNYLASAMGISFLEKFDSTH